MDRKQFQFSLSVATLLVLLGIAVMVGQASIGGALVGLGIAIGAIAVVTNITAAKKSPETDFEPLMMPIRVQDQRNNSSKHNSKRGI